MKIFSLDFLEKNEEYKTLEEESEQASEASTPTVDAPFEPEVADEAFEEEELEEPPYEESVFAINFPKKKKAITIDEIDFFTLREQRLSSHKKFAQRYEDLVLSTANLEEDKDKTVAVEIEKIENKLDFSEEETLLQEEKDATEHQLQIQEIGFETETMSEAGEDSVTQKYTHPLPPPIPIEEFQVSKPTPAEPNLYSLSYDAFQKEDASLQQSVSIVDDRKQAPLEVPSKPPPIAKSIQHRFESVSLNDEAAEEIIPRTPPPIPELPFPPDPESWNLSEEQPSYVPQKHHGKFPFHRQHDQMDCGPACLEMIADYYGRFYTLQTLRRLCHIDREGVSLLGISEGAEALGFSTIPYAIPYEKINEVETPFIAHWNQNHFVVVYKVTRKHVFVNDPAHGSIKYTHEEFKKGWISSIKDGEETGVLLTLKPTNQFYIREGEKEERTKFSFLFNYLRPYKGLLIQLFLGLLIGSILSLIVPFLSQALVDEGIQNQNLGFVTLIIIAQLALFVGQTVVSFLRSWILLHLGIRLNISLLTDFLIKLTKLPFSFFGTRSLGDILQRMGDHQRIEQFLTANTLNIAFSLVTFVVFSIVLIAYNPLIFLIFLASTFISLIWVFLFLKRRKDLDYKAFSENAATQNKIVQLVAGITELKLNNATRQKRWEWERIQAKLFRIGIKELALEQYQSVGLLFITQVSNIIVTYMVAKSVIEGAMTLGMLVAIQYIIGQLAAPIAQFIGFVHTVQDAKISIERIAEIYDYADEQPQTDETIHTLPNDKSIYLENVTFSYNGSQSATALDHFDLTIPEGKVTAIVGLSGSGKTTLLKLLLKLYEPTEGNIYVGPFNLKSMDNTLWRSKCGTVMQDGYLFEDTIANNIAIGEENIDQQKLMDAAYYANLLEFVDKLPLGFNTMIGMDGRGLSQGQLQRILIARALYKNPAYLFFDEATSALDATNEKIIMDNLSSLFGGRTVVVIAHRLSTVKNADNIVVIQEGRLIESGTHETLVRKKGTYYHLVKNQLDLGT